MKCFKLFLCCLLFTFLANAQSGKYFPVSNAKCKNVKIYIDYRIQEYCGNAFTIEWTGGCKDGLATGKGLLTISSKVSNRSFTMTYEGVLKSGKKEGDGLLNLFLFYPGMSPYYWYKGFFKNDEFDGFGDFKSDYPYPVKHDDIGKGVSMELLGLNLAIWRSDLFFYEYKGVFLNGKIADTENGMGKTKRLLHIGDEVQYTGGIKNGRPNGKGVATEVTVIILPNAQSYLSMSGNFVNGKVNGYGKQTGRYFEYDGEFVNGIREGKGKLTHYEFIGFIAAKKNNLKEGKQVSSIIDGTFKNGNADGLCTVYFQNSAAYKYTGPMKDGEIEGTGEIEYLDGAKFRGNFRNGKREGPGAVLFVNGDKFSGEYLDDKPVKGILYFEDGAKYEGGFTVNEERNSLTGKLVNMYKRHGRGEVTEKNGRKYFVYCENDNCTEIN